MGKWFDANGVDVDAYPERAFRGGVYDGGILGTRIKEKSPMRIRRISPTGLEFLVDTICNDKNRVKVTLERSQEKSVEVKLSLDEFSQCWFDWQMRGQNIQLAFPTVPACVREFFMTAITPEEWDKIFSETDDEERTKSETSSEQYERYLKNFPLDDPRD